jgi:hypothetical protein
LRVTTSRSSSASSASSASWPFRTTTIRHGTSKSFVSKNKKKVFLLCVVTCSVHPDLEQNILQQWKNVGTECHSSDLSMAAAKRWVSWLYLECIRVSM